MYKSLLAILLSLVTSFADHGDPIVTLPDGKIRGHTLVSDGGNVYYAFQEIPFAAPPVGELRFKPPQPPKKWKGILDTKENTKICYQAEKDYPLPGNVSQTEDCLYLNVYTPQRPGSSSALLPVFVWIHGGGFVYGSGTFQDYGPKFFIDSDIVIAALNYRLGPLGFLTTNDGVISANIGLRDQNLALQWVKQNIKLFGGDPKKITIAGESAGAISVGFQLLSKKSEDLFTGAILQSGSALLPASNQYFSKYIAFELGKTLDPSFTSNDSNNLLDLLSNASATDISYTNLKLPAEPDVGGLFWVPVVECAEDEEAFVTGPMHEDIKNGNINQVPILIGFNSEEELYFLYPDPSELRETGILYDQDPSVLLKNVFNMKDEDRLRSGEELRQIYTDTLFQDNFAGLVAYSSDFVFTTPVCRHADLQSQYTDVYLYQFSYKGDLSGFKWDIEGIDPNGVGHGEDLYYIFERDNNSDTSQFPKQDILTRCRVMKLWSNFVKGLNPTPEEDELLQNVTWPRVTPGELNYLDINTTLEVKIDPKQYKKWKKIVDKYAIPPFYTY